MNTNYLIEWILKQSGLKVVFFVQYIDHVQTLRIGFASIWKEDILLVSLLKTSCFTNRMSSFHFRAKHIRNVWTWSYTVNSRSFQPWRDHQEGFSNQKRMLFRGVETSEKVFYWIALTSRTKQFDIQHFIASGLMRIWRVRHMYRSSPWDIERQL